ncbi:MAG: TIGR00730 family Rossman fold protein [Planctomycetes bacterium]|nr:TIGR00730 family Rossman fold protein [Planctomycetota bacterium]
MRSLCVFCGSSPGRDPAYLEAAREMGALLAGRGIGLVYGGGGTGLMGALADAVLSAGGRATGVIPRGLQVREVAHDGLTELHVVESMHERKALMARLADGYVALPGGMGTLEEIAEILTWGQLGIHRKPCGLLDVGGYWTHLVATFDRFVDEGFLRPLYRELLVTERRPSALLDALLGWNAPDIPRWIAADES